MDKSKYYKLLVESCGCEVSKAASKEKVKYSKLESIFEDGDSYNFKIIRAMIKETYSGGIDAHLKIIGPYRDSTFDLFSCYSYSKDSQDNLKKKVKELESVKEQIDNFLSALKKEVKEAK